MGSGMGCFEAAWLFLWGLIKESAAYKILTKIYGGISGAWRDSRITGLFRRQHVNDALKNSIAGRIVRCPVTFCEFLNRRFGARLADAADKSLLLGLCRCYLNNIMALNLRFIGLMLLFSAEGIAIGEVVSGGSVGRPLILATILGVILSLFNVNLTDYLKSSLIVRLICTCLGTEADFNWYDGACTKGNARFVFAAVLGLVFGMLGGFVNPLLTPLAIAGAAGIILIMKSPQAGAFLIVFAAPLVPTMAVVGLALLTVFALIVKSVTDKSFRWRFDGIDFLVLVFIVVYMFAAATSFAKAKSFSIWAIYCAFMAVYFVIVNTVKSKKMLMNLLTVFVLSGFLVCLYGIAQYAFGWDTTQAWMDEEMFSDIKMRIYSTLGNPNVLGEYILLVLPISVGLMWTKKGAPAKVIYAGITVVMLGALILTFSRGCWVGLLAAAAIFITFAAGKLWGLGLIALPILPMIMPKSIINRFTSIGDMKDSSTSYRVYIWMGTLAMVKDFWLSGIGMGQEAFTQVYPFYSYSGIVAPHSHNLFLQILVESGVVGIAVFLMIVFIFLRKMTLGYQFEGKGSATASLITAAAAGICGFLVQGMFDNCFYNYRVMLVFWCVLAMGRACAYAAEESSAERNKSLAGGEATV